MNDRKKLIAAVITALVLVGCPGNPGSKSSAKSLGMGDIVHVISGHATVTITGSDISYISFLDDGNTESFPIKNTYIKLCDCKK